jgi:GAF domain
VPPRPGLLLADPLGELRVVAASSEAARLLELFQLQNDQGPCLDCFRAGQPVATGDLAAAARRWPRFAPAARQAGFAAVQALPMRLHDQVIGALNLFRAAPGTFDPADVRVGQALADAATISLLHERSMRRSDTLNEQLQTALNSRVIIEQANRRAARPGHGPGVQSPARPRPGPQPAPVRPGPGLRRRHHHQPDPATSPQPLTGAGQARSSPARARRPGRRPRWCGLPADGPALCVPTGGGPPKPGQAGCLLAVISCAAAAPFFVAVMRVSGSRRVMGS